MQSIIDAIKLKISGSALETDVNGRVYLDEADDMTLPYCVWFVVTAPKEKTFQENFRNALIQFSIFEAKTAGIGAMTTIYNDLDVLFDECTLTITGDTFLRMNEVNLTTMMDSITTPEGSVGVRQWNVDYSVEVQI